MRDIWSAIREAFPGVVLESPIQGWAFLGEFQEGLRAHEKIPFPSPQDDRWLGVCYFHLLQDESAVRALERSAKRGEVAATMFLAHVLPFLGRAAEGLNHLESTDYEALGTYDKALFKRIKSLAEERSGDLRSSLAAAEEAWRIAQSIPEYPLIAPSILIQLATLHGRIGRAQRAIWFLERALLITSPTEELKIRIRRTTTLIDLGRYLEAATELRAIRPMLIGSPLESETQLSDGKIALANNRIAQAIQLTTTAIRTARRDNASYEEFLGHLTLTSLYCATGRYDKALQHLGSAQSLITDKADRLQYRFHEVLLNSALGKYSPQHTRLEFNGLIHAFDEMGLLQEQAVVKLYRADLLFHERLPGWSRDLTDLVDLSISLQNRNLLAREWPLLPEFREVAANSHPDVVPKPPDILEVRTLGTEELLLNGEPVRIPLKRGIELLAYMLQHRAVALHAILNDVFQNEKQSTAKSYFHQFRHQLREHLEQVQIEYDAEARLYRLRSEIDVLWDVQDLRAGQYTTPPGPFLPSSQNSWVAAINEEIASREP